LRCEQSVLATVAADGVRAPERLRHWACAACGSRFTQRADAALVKVLAMTPDDEQAQRVSRGA
jgi:hypothetical protein